MPSFTRFMESFFCRTGASTTPPQPSRPRWRYIPTITCAQHPFIRGVHRNVGRNFDGYSIACQREEPLASSWVANSSFGQSLELACNGHGVGNVGTRLDELGLPVGRSRQEVHLMVVGGTHVGHREPAALQLNQYGRLERMADVDSPRAVEDRINPNPPGKPCVDSPCVGAPTTTPSHHPHQKAILQVPK